MANRKGKKKNKKESISWSLLHGRLELIEKYFDLGFSSSWDAWNVAKKKRTYIYYHVMETIPFLFFLSFFSK